MGKSCPNGAAKEFIIYLFVWANSCILFTVSYCSNCPSRIGKKLNWNVTQAVEKPYMIGISSHRDIWCVVPFSNNISCHRTHKVCLCFGYHNPEQSDIWVTKWRCSLQRGRGTQQENSTTKHHIDALERCGYKRILCIRWINDNTWHAMEYTVCIQLRSYSDPPWEI